jgi:hypothetical protein
MNGRRLATDAAQRRLPPLLAAGLFTFCLLSPTALCLARPPAQPNGPTAPSGGSEASRAGSAFGLIPLAAYAAAAAVIVGGTALFAFVSLRREAQESAELSGQKELDLLSQHAEAHARLYERYGKRFSAQYPLWDTLVADEQKHSRWIRAFAQRIRSGEATLCRELFPYGRVASALDQAQQLARAAEQADLDGETALRNALQQEKERLEWVLPELFTISAAKFANTLDLLQSEAQAHQRSLSAAIESGPREGGAR